MASLLISESKLDRQVRQEVAAAEANVSRFLEKLDFARKRFERAGPLVERKAVSAQEFERIEAAMKELQAAVLQAEFERDLTKEKLSMADSNVQSSREMLKAARSEAQRVRQV